MRRGFTLLELIVVLGVFSVFGLVLAIFMRAGVVNYKNSRYAATIDAEASSLLDMIRSDLVCAAPRTNENAHRIFLSIYAANRQVTAFSRSITADIADIRAFPSTVPSQYEIPDYIDNDPGDGIDNDGDGSVDEEALNGIDDDLDGLIDEDCFGNGFVDEDCKAVIPPMIVAYTCDPIRYNSKDEMYPPRPVLWRGITWTSISSVGLAGMASQSNIHKYFIPVSRSALFLEFRYGLNTTNTYSIQYPPSLEGELRGPEVKWDSTRSLPPTLLGSDQFAPLWRDFFFSKPGATTAEWVIPNRIMIVLGMLPDDKAFARLATTLPINADSVYLDTTDGLSVYTDPQAADIHNVLLIDGEWINYSAIEGNRVIISKRGAKFTYQANHSEGALVYAPKVYTVEVTIPAGFTPY